MRTFWRTLLKPVYLPLIDKLEDIYYAFSPSGRAVFLFFSALLVVSSGYLLFAMNERLLFPIPGYGGTLTEGIVGSPRFINPVLAVSDADRDLSTLVYSGLLRATPSGGYEPSLASSFTTSNEGSVYTVTLNKNATFSDGAPVTASDVVFTVSKIQDPQLKSPLRASWDGVTTEELDAHTVRFTLKTAYTPFIENLTVGILPKHLWQNVSSEEFPFSELNTSPVGSGPFEIKTIVRTPSGIPSSYDLVPFNNYLPGRPYLGHLIFKFYQSETATLAALKSEQVEAASGISPALVPEIDNEHIERSPLNRVFGVFFNQNQSEVLRDISVRRALEAAIDRKALINQVLGGYGTPLDGPVPPSIFGENSSASDNLSQDDHIASAQDILTKAGWKIGTDGILAKTVGTGKTATTRSLKFSLSTGNVPELRAAAEYLRVTWQKLGVSVDVKIFDQGDLSQNVIRPRKYDALLFGEVIGREVDLYAFWDSSQRNDPGLNIALYANPTVDKILSQLRTAGDDSGQATLYAQFKSELAKDTPAVFLYVPDFVYSVPKDIKGINLGFIETPSDRFLNVAQWHREIDYVWPLFVKNNK